MMGQHPSGNKLMIKAPKEELVRTASAPAVPTEEAYAAMYAGNARYAAGFGGMLKTDDDDLLLQLSEGGQNPISIVLGHYKCGAITAAVQTIGALAAKKEDGTYDLSS